jgi:hypothetical protein
LSALPPVRASCGSDVDAMFNFQCGDDVAMPTLPTKEEFDVDVERSDPTVSCDVVARSVVPAPSETMMEEAGNEVAFVPPLATVTVPSVIAPPPVRTSNDWSCTCYCCSSYCAK